MPLVYEGILVLLNDVTITLLRCSSSSADVPAQQTCQLSRCASSADVPAQQTCQQTVASQGHRQSSVSHKAAFQKNEMEKTPTIDIKRTSHDLKFLTAKRCLPKL